ncbi:hypothetical protein [Pseudonocardia spinosispora]|uniref:hypothetical protein n=1 Tax=Pseudonocardia spinosispora TaxID=103441 RepID=UPI00041FD4EF|nr:hypothetical protein [Pseudonocardia spinosispora]
MSRTKRALSVAALVVVGALATAGVSSASDHGDHHHDRDDSGLLSIVDIHLDKVVDTVVNVATDLV